MTEEEIHKICKIYKIQNYRINSDMSIDVDGGVDLTSKLLVCLPLKFKNVSGSFLCQYNLFSTLKGCPEYIGGDFHCFGNELTTLEYCTQKIDGNFRCGSNQLSTLNGCPKHVAGEFDCYNNELLTLNGLPMNFYVGGNFLCESNKISDPSEFGKIFFGYIGVGISTGFDNINKFLNNNKNPPKKDLPRLLSELRKITL